MVSSILLIMCHLKNVILLTVRYLFHHHPWTSCMSHIFLRLFRHRKCFSVSDRNTALRRCNPGPVLPTVPRGFVEYEPGPKSHTSTSTLTHTHRQKHKKSHPSSSIPLSPALTSHLNSKVRLFISLPHPIKPASYKRMKPTLPSCC